MRAGLLALVLVAGASMAAAAEDRVYEGEVTARSVRDYVARLLDQDWVSESRSYALVVGISDYDDATGYKDLPTKDDAHRVRRFLIEEAGFDHVHVLTEEAATKARIEELMDGVFPRLVDGNDRFFFYWSGHGDQRQLAGGGERGYLPVADSKRGQWWRMIGMDLLKRWDETLRARQALYLLDACFSGLAGVAAKSSLRDLTLAQLAQPSRQLLTAGTAEEEAIAGDRWGGSLFTAAVLDGLRGEADATTAYEPDGVVSFSELVGYVRLRVADEKERAGWRAAITPQPRALRVNQGEFFVVLPPEADAETGAAAGTTTDAAPTGKGAAALTAAEVEEIQAMLAALGLDPGPVDGILGLRTRGALKRFQREQRLDETATPDTATRQALLEAWAGHSRNVAPWAQGRSEEPPATIALEADILFDFESAEIEPQFEDVLLEVAQLVQSNDEYVTVEGHTDSVEKNANDSAAMRLGQSRADAVAAYLVSQGLERSRIATVSYGRDRPVVSNDTPEGRQLNRRVEIKN